MLQCASRLSRAADLARSSYCCNGCCEQVTDISAAEVKALLDKAEPVILVDVRTDEEQEVCINPTCAHTCNMGQSAAKPGSGIELKLWQGCWQVSMIKGAMTKAAFEKEKEQHKGDAIITYWYSGLSCERLWVVCGLLHHADQLEMCWTSKCSPASCRRACHTT